VSEDPIVDGDVATSVAPPDPPPVTPVERAPVTAAPPPAVGMRMRLAARLGSRPVR
jgi:hypothetical protein